ncbi:TatD family hydrolase [Prevotella sp. 10(H)]|uniref:TatD family hydrolase n=1 Tax=Prevotella sp. 10(H) TaxID=1158294 RepID=UPI001E633745|nr:TatD family hydrolase [Prevotella sp. 10(H)]
MSRQISLLEEIASDERVVAIGEAGLDKMKGPDINIQIDVFRQQIELAVKVGKPLIIHCVKAWDELVALHKEYKTDIPWIIHGYRGNAQQAAQLGKIGFKFSFGEHFNEETLRSLPIESIFCETDTSEVTICKVYSSISDVLHIEINQFVEKIEYNIKKYIK